MDIEKRYDQLMKNTIILLSLLSFSISFAQDVVGVSLSDRSSDPKIVLTQKANSCLAIYKQTTNQSYISP